MAPDGFFFDSNEFGGPPKARRVARAPLIYDCKSCKLDEGCISPRMEPFGDGRLGIMIVADAPGETDDDLGRPLLGKSGQLLLEQFAKCGVSIDKDCLRTNVVHCCPPKGRQATDIETRCCRSRLEAQIKAMKPDLILAFGSEAMSAILSDSPETPSEMKWHGLMVPSDKWHAWVGCSLHPDFFLRGNRKDQVLIRQAIQAGLDKLKAGPYQSQQLDESQFEVLEDMASVRNMLATIGSKGQAVMFDYEATGTNIYDPAWRFLGVGLADCKEKAYFIPLEHQCARWSPSDLKEVYRLWKGWLAGPTRKRAHNWAFEELASRHRLDTPVQNVDRCTMVMQHVLDNREGICNLEFQTYARYGTVYKTTVNKGLLAETPLDQVARYCSLDCRYAWQLGEDQDREADAKLLGAYNWLHPAIPRMVSLKQTGIKLDLTGMKEFEQSVLRDLDAVVKGRQNAKCLAEFCRVQGHAWTPSPADRQTLFYKQLQLAPLREASEKTGNISVDADSMDHLLTQVPEGSETWQLIDGLRKEAHLQKLLGTYIKGLVSLVDGRGLLHPSFNLHSTVTYRSSSSGPSFQNIPVRNPVLSRVRKYMVPQNDYFLECDISGSELRWISHTTRCKKMIDQVNADVNIHRFWAHRLFQICEVDITKTQRATAKTYAVFPWCYGDYWKNVAANCGIDQSHAQAVEAEFFSPDYYKDVRRWQDNLVTEYNEKGYVQSELGFRMRGPMKRTEIYNGLIQGISFHKVLDVLVKVARDMEGGNYKSTITGQIHDSIVFDVVDSEAADLMKMTNGYMETPSWGWDNRIRIKCEWKAGLNFLETDAVQ